MDDLKSMDCARVKGEEATLTEEEIKEYKSQIPDWEIVEENGVKRLRRAYKFRNFREALAFTNKIGELAEEQDHHPQIITEWGKVTLSWWTHVVDGLHLNDFIMAAKSDQAYKS
ncbi:MAG TPA: 4a-hydroxytetrahydrobiopterin dehydratase [Anaerolineales bacterium]